MPISAEPANGRKRYYWLFPKGDYFFHHYNDTGSLSAAILSTPLATILFPQALNSCLNFLSKSLCQPLNKTDGVT